MTRIDETFRDVRVVVARGYFTIWDATAPEERVDGYADSIVMTRDEAAFVRDQITAALAAGLVKP